MSFARKFESGNYQLKSIALPQHIIDLTGSKFKWTFLTPLYMAATEITTKITTIINIETFELIHLPQAALKLYALENDRLLTLTEPNILTFWNLNKIKHQSISRDEVEEFKNTVLNVETCIFRDKDFIFL